MKQSLLLLLFVSLFIASCGSDDDATPCDSDDLAMTIVGEWDEEEIFGVGGEVTFNADGTGSCTDGSLFETELNDNVSNDFVYTISSDTTSIDFDYPNGLGVTYNVESVDCDRVVLETFGFDVVLNRK